VVEILAARLGGSMTDKDKRFGWHVERGNTVTVGDISVTPQSRALIARWPHGGWVWNRPAAVMVKQGEDERRIPIVDVTRMAQLGLFGLSLVFGVIGLVMWMMGRSGSDERDA
jgi:hypothetical protein